MPEQTAEKPKLLQAVELILAKPSVIRQQALDQLANCRKKFANKLSDDEIRDESARKVIEKYSNLAALAGAVTALPGIVPGVGTVAAIAGGAIPDMAACMKWQIEMVWEIATIYDYDISVEDEKNICYVVACVGTIGEAGKEGAKTVGTKAFIRMTQQYLKGALLEATKQLFKRVGIIFTRSALQKAIPFGVGVVIGAGANKGLTSFVGNRSLAFYKDRAGLAVDDDIDEDGTIDVESQIT